MVTCRRCRTDYDDALADCPSCGAPNLRVGLRPRSRRRCGPFAYFCLRFAQFATLVAAAILLITGVLALVRGQILQGLAALLIATPISIGQFVAFGLAVQYSEHQS